MKLIAILLTLHASFAFAQDPIPNEITALDLPSQNTFMPLPLLEEIEVKPLQQKSVFLATSLSYLFPGLGHAYLGDMRTASGLMGSAGFAATHSEKSLGTAALGLQTVWFYGIYAAYRDARAFNGQQNYRYPMPQDTLVDLTFAPFQGSVVKKKTVWGGVVGALAAAVCLVVLTGPKAAITPSLSTKGLIRPYYAMPIAISEEVLFRGFLQSNITENTNPYIGGLLSSLAFGAAHIPNARALPEEDRANYYRYSLPFITALGAYSAWMTYQTKSLKESTAFHMWYDFTLFAAAAYGNRAAAIPSSFALHFDF